MEKHMPYEGEPLYLHKKTGSYYVDLCKEPYTVCRVCGDSVIVRKAMMHFPIFRYDPRTMSDYYAQFDGKETRFFDTVAIGFEDDPRGEEVLLKYNAKTGEWQHKSYPGDKYPDIAVFGRWEHQPYLD